MLWALVFCLSFIRLPKTQGKALKCIQNENKGCWIDNMMMTALDQLGANIVANRT